MEQFNLNMIPGKVAPVCHASQYDTGRKIGVYLFAGDQIYTLDGTEVVTISVRKPDGHIVTEGITNTGSNYLEIVTTEQMTACQGANLCELKIEKGADVIGSLNFILSVEADPLAGGDPSESFIYNLETQIAAAVADQYDSANVIFDAAPTAGHGQPYTVTSEGIKNAIDDAIDALTIPENITDLDDVEVISPTDGEILAYGADGKLHNVANPASTANFAPDYDDTATYNTNDKVIYQGLLYVCLEDSVTGAWDGTKWQQISVADYSAEMLPIQSGSATNTKDYIDTGLSGKADKNSLPNYITQTSGQTAQFRSIGVFFYYYADQWNAHIPFLFVTKNTNYTITLNEVIAENIGDITNKCSVIGKASTYFDIQTTKTMTALPNSFSVCVCRCLYTIQWS